MSPYEVLYGRRCRSPAGWHKLEDTMIRVPKMLEEMEQEVKKVQQNLKVSQDRQKY